MAWDTELVTLLRSIIGDIDTGSPSYTDSKLQSIILASAQFLEDLEFNHDYIVDIDSNTLSPDPTTGTKDNGFINLVVLKAACILANAELQRRSSQAVAIKDGPSSIDGKGIIATLQDWADRMCKGFQSAELEHRLGAVNPGQAIIGPHRTEYSGYSYPYNHRSRGTYGY